MMYQMIFKIVNKGRIRVFLADLSAVFYQKSLITDTI